MIDVRLSYNTVTSDTFDEFDWNNQTNLDLHKYLHDISSEQLALCGNSLKNLKFSSLTKVSNLISILQHCPYIEHLTFDDAIIDEYWPFNWNPLLRSSNVLRHDQLATLIIICPWGITKNEYWLLDFFTRAVDLPGLTSLSFYSYTTIGGLGGPVPAIGPRNLQVSPFKENTEVVEKFCTLNTDSIVADFLCKFRPTLKRLWVGRPGFELPNNARVGEGLLQLKLSFLSVSLGSSGIQFLLETQTELETLNLVSNLSLVRGPFLSVEEISENLNHFYACIIRNSRTLKEVKLVPTIIAHSSRDELLRQHKVLDLLTVDCQIFEQCSQLQYLCLSLRGYQDDMDMWMDLPPILQGTKIRNLHKIPTESLVELYLPVEEYSRDEFEQFAAKFGCFVNLKKLYFGTSQLNELNSFLVRIPWMQMLLNLPKIEKIVFHNGVLQDADIVRRLVVNSRHDGLNVTMSYNAPRYTFEFHRQAPHAEHS